MVNLENGCDSFLLSDIFYEQTFESFGALTGKNRFLTTKKRHINLIYKEPDVTLSRSTLNECDQNRKWGLYWLPLRVVAVNAAIVGLPARLPAHVPRQLHRHASLCTPLNGCTFLLLTFALWKKDKKNITMRSPEMVDSTRIPEMLNGSDCGSESLLLNIDSAKLLKYVIL